MKQDGKRILETFGRAIVLAAAASFVLLLLLAFVMLKLQPDMKTAEYLILAVYVISCFLGGWYCGRRMGQRKFLWGLLLGLLYALLLLAISGLCEQTLQPALLQSFRAFALCAAGGMAGGMLAR